MAATQEPVVGSSLSGPDFRKLFESSSSLSLVLDPSLRIVAVTDSYLSATMTRREEILGKQIFEVFPDNPNDPVADGVRNLSASLHTVLESRRVHKMSMQRYDIRKQGSEEFEERYWSPINSPILDEQGEVQLIVHNVSDCTETVRLGRAEDDLLRFFDISLDMLCISGQDGYFHRVSPAFTETLGWSSEELIATPYIEFVHPDDVEATEEEVRKQNLTGESVLHFENRYRHKDGSYRTLSWRSIPQPNGLMYASARDVTQAKAAQHELESAREKADRASRAKNEFLSRMSHELRTPMNAVLGYAQLIELRSNDPGSQTSARAILRGGRHLLDLINEILDLSRIEAGKLALSLEPVSVQSAITVALELVKPAADTQNIQLELDRGAIEGVHVRADRQRFVQVLVNLLSNAIKFNRPGGKVSLVCEQSADGQVHIEVRDTGTGIPAKDLHLLFEPFNRFSNESVEGTGLGLALSRSLAQLMEGDLELVESSSSGTTFVLLLRRVDAPRLDAKRDEGLAALQDNSSRTLLKVICIEDNLSNLELLEKVFEVVGGVELLAAARASVGISLVEDHLPDLVLLDLHLPDSHGYNVLKTLKSNPKTQKIPVVVVSADATSSQINRLLEAGAKAYLTKPLELPLLFAQLNEVRAGLEKGD